MRVFSLPSHLLITRLKTSGSSFRPTSMASSISASLPSGRCRSRKRGGSVVSITASLADHPIAGVTASVAMITKGGIESISKNLAMEYAQEGIRFNSVAPGVVDTPLHQDNPKDLLRTRSPMGGISDAQEIVDAV